MGVQSRHDDELTTALDKMGVETRTGQQAFARSGDSSRGRPHEHQHDEYKQERRDRYVIANAVGRPRIGLFIRRRNRSLEKGLMEDFGVILAATWPLLGLIIGFSCSMAIGRYDQRKNYEEGGPVQLAPKLSRRICCLQPLRLACGR